MLRTTQKSFSLKKGFSFLNNHLSASQENKNQLDNLCEKALYLRSKSVNIYMMRAYQYTIQLLENIQFLDNPQTLGNLGKDALRDYYNAAKSELTENALNSYMEGQQAIAAIVQYVEKNSNKNQGTLRSHMQSFKRIAKENEIFYKVGSTKEERIENLKLYAAVLQDLTGIHSEPYIFISCLLKSVTNLKEYDDIKIPPITQLTCALNEYFSPLKVSQHSFQETIDDEKNKKVAEIKRVVKESQGLSDFSLSEWEKVLFSKTKKWLDAPYDEKNRLLQGLREHWNTQYPKEIGSSEKPSMKNVSGYTGSSQSVPRSKIRFGRPKLSLVIN